MLMSIASLKKMGAVIDFATGCAIYKSLDREVVVQLERSSSGHLLMDLAEDLYKDQVAPQPEDEPLQRLAAGQPTSPRAERADGPEQ